MPAGAPGLVLASSSRHRARLLERLKIPFESVAPQVDETPQPGEDAPQLAARLARSKTRAVAALRPGVMVLGADQVAVTDERMLGKPGTRDRAIEQLAHCSGRCVNFVTAIHLINTVTGSERSACVTCRVQFRVLTTAEIERYVAVDQPFDSVGSFLSESLGIALFERVTGDDPTALVGLPLISVARLMREEGIDVIARAAGAAS
jgi:septum formation protein